MKRIKENVADLTEEYIKKVDLIAENYVKELERIIVSNNELEDYVKSILIKRLSCYSYYEISDRILYCDLRRQLKSFSEDTAGFYNNASERELKGGQYLYLAQMIIHECDHASHFKKACENKPDLETKILRSVYIEYLPTDAQKYPYYPLSLVYKTKTKIQNILCDVLDDILYNRYYNYAPEDRLADIHSYKETLKIAKLLGLECSYKYHSSMLYDTYLDSYDQEEPPTIYYFMKTRRRELAEELKQLSGSLDFDTRLNLGLLLTKKELKKLERNRDNI